MDKKASRRDFLNVLAVGGVGLIGSSLPRNTINLLKDLNPYGLDDRTYRRRMKVLEQGYATSIPAFEFHGDYYSFYNGAYSMSKEYFKTLMRWFKDNDYWALSVQETIDYIQGKELMPAKSVMFTTDSGNVSQPSLTRMIPTLEETGMHFQSYIWTKEMDEGEHQLCHKDACWDAFNRAYETGLFSFGTHSEEHKAMAHMNYQDGLADLLESKNDIETNMDVEVQLISWPFESVPSWASKLSEYGYIGGFAGNSRNALSKLYTVPNEPSPWNMPRIFPPNPHSLESGRPSGYTIDEIMNMYSNGKELVLPEHPYINMLIKHIHMIDGLGYHQIAFNK